LYRKGEKEEKEEEEKEEGIYLPQISNDHGNSTPTVIESSRVARKPEGQQCWPPIEYKSC